MIVHVHAKVVIGRKINSLRPSCTFKRENFVQRQTQPHVHVHVQSHDKYLLFSVSILTFEGRAVCHVVVEELSDLPQKEAETLVESVVARRIHT